MMSSEISSSRAGARRNSVRARVSILLPALLSALSACSSSSDAADPGVAGAPGHAEGGRASTTGGASGAQAGNAGLAGAAGSASSTSAGGASGGSSSGGSGNAGGAAMAGSNAGGSSGSAGAAGSPAGKIFSQARFHFGTIDSIAKNAGSSMIAQLDFFTSGWLQGDSFDHNGVCNDTKSGAVLANQVPVLVAYISAAHVKRQDNTMCDCNVTKSPCVAANDLCHQGAARISQEFTAIVNAYKSYSDGFAKCYGTTRPMVFEMEPDWYQYTTSSQSAPWTPKQAGQMLGQLVAALKSSLPNARFSIDASPWVGPSNGGDNGAQWYANFDLSLFTFVNTSGGGTNANTAKIRSPNEMTWAGLSKVTGKPILADTGYGANGSAAGEDPLWNDPANINARIADGVVSISQYNPTSSWGSTIASLRSQLNTPKFSP
jgi:hypothetical protein